MTEDIYTWSSEVYNALCRLDYCILNLKNELEKDNSCKYSQNLLKNSVIDIKEFLDKETFSDAYHEWLKNKYKG